MAMNRALTIAGSDSSGGAGIQADLKTFQERKVYGLSALTTIVTMNPHDNWAHEVFPVDLTTIRKQVATSLEGIGVDALKTGLLSSVEIIELVAEIIKGYEGNVVIDPVMVCKGTDEVLVPETVVSLREVLVPRATIVTPNLFEAAQLSQMDTIQSIDDLKQAATVIHELGADQVLIKGGSKLQHEQAIDLYYDGQHYEVLEAERIDTPYVHGAGCTYSAAITAELAKGNSIKQAVHTAKAFITEAIRQSFRLNQYIGPVQHAAYRIANEEQSNSCSV